MKHFIKIYLVFLLAFISTTVQSQSCGSCASPYSSDTLLIKITASDSATYLIGTGKTLCIFAGAKFTGTVTLNGGFICNKGKFSPKVFTVNSGTLTNSGNCRIPSITLTSGKVIKNTPKSILNVEGGNFTINGGTLINEGILNLDENLINTSGTLVNKSIINCKQVTGNNALTNLGIINSN
ncbi:MAG: hypothetical protein IT236_04485 [Bacteroidia bacterium]|nr:hypothetical protein [Bacteroidia bacterium]